MKYMFVDSRTYVLYWYVMHVKTTLVPIGDQVWLFKLFTTHYLYINPTMFCYIIIISYLIHGNNDQETIMYIYKKQENIPILQRT